MKKPALSLCLLSCLISFLLCGPLSPLAHAAPPRWVRGLVSTTPVQQERERMGFWVLGFIAIFFIFTVLLKKEFWRDVH